MVHRLVDHGPHPPSSMSSAATPVFAACCNLPYLPHVATMLRSYASSATTPGRCFFAHDDSVTPSVQRQLLSFARECGIDLEVIKMPDELTRRFEERSRYPRIAWYRTML